MTCGVALHSVLFPGLQVQRKQNAEPVLPLLSKFHHQHPARNRATHHLPQTLRRETQTQPLCSDSHGMCSLDSFDGAGERAGLVLPPAAALTPNIEDPPETAATSLQALRLHADSRAFFSSPHLLAAQPHGNPTAKAASASSCSLDAHKWGARCHGVKLQERVHGAAGQRCHRVCVGDIIPLDLGAANPNTSQSKSRVWACARAQEFPDFQLLQPHSTVSVSPGETLTLTCSVTGLAPTGPVKWFKGSGSGQQLVYADTGSFPRVTRAVNGSDTDFTIRISDTRPEDAGIYHCVKFRKGSGADEEFRSGAGTAVSVSDSASSGSVSSGSVSSGSVSPVTAAAVTVCVLLVVLFLVSAYFFVRKNGGRSPCTARSQTPLPDNTRAQSQPSDGKDPDVLYADLKHSPRLQQPKKSAPEEQSEYAAIKVTQAGAR
ncbi:uncharacterized protein RBU57_013759 [Macrochelys suwanniensis]